MDQVVIETTMGSFTIELDAARAPKTVQNFLAYVDAGHYAGTIFHRVIDGFMVQGGGYDAAYDKKTTRAPIMNEADNGVKNERGTVAMARTNDPHSATAQFFVNVSDNTFLNHKSKTDREWGYTVFGKVTSGWTSSTTGRKWRARPFAKDAPSKPSHRLRPPRLKLCSPHAVRGARGVPD
jgi:peptidyl-prolyl cis-trans isomerase B (cyclophilin B)